MNYNATFTSQQIKDFVSTLDFKEEKITKNSNLLRISVVIPSFNQGEYLERTIISIVNQRYPNTELILLDSNSTDETLSIIEKYEKYIDVKIIEKDRGQADAINKGFKLATGDVLAWQNSDDIYLPGYFWSICKIFHEQPDADFVIGNYYAIDAEDNIIYGTHFGPFLLSALIYHTWNLGSQSAFVRADVARSVGDIPLYPVAFDWEWYIRVARASRRIVVVKRYGGGYRLHPDAKLSTMDLQKRQELEKTVLQNIGIAFNSKKSMEDQWPIRRFILRAIKRLNKKMLYSNKRFGSAKSMIWSAIWNALGFRILGFGRR